MCIVHTGGAFEVSTTTCRHYVHVCILDTCFFAHLFPRSVYNVRPDACLFLYIDVVHVHDC